MSVYLLPFFFASMRNEPISAVGNRMKWSVPFLLLISTLSICKMEWWRKKNQFFNFMSSFKVAHKKRDDRFFALRCTHCLSQQVVLEKIFTTFLLLFAWTAQKQYQIFILENALALPGFIIYCLYVSFSDSNSLYCLILSLACLLACLLAPSSSSS